MYAILYSQSNLFHSFSPSRFFLPSAVAVTINGTTSFCCFPLYNFSLSSHTHILTHSRMLLFLAYSFIFFQKKTVEFNDASELMLLLCCWQISHILSRQRKMRVTRKEKKRKEQRIKCELAYAAGKKQRSFIFISFRFFPSSSSVYHYLDVYQDLWSIFVHQNKYRIHSPNVYRL